MTSLAFQNKHLRWEEPSMDQYQCTGKLLKNFQDHWSIRISPGKGMDQWLVHMNFPRNLYGPMALKVLWKFRSWPVLVHRLLFPASASRDVMLASQILLLEVERGVSLIGDGCWLPQTWTAYYVYLACLLTIQSPVSCASVYVMTLPCLSHPLLDTPALIGLVDIPWWSWDPDCLVQGPNSWISPKIDKGRSK